MPGEAIEALEAGAEENRSPLHGHRVDVLGDRI
jgi:hypothetical protein